MERFTDLDGNGLETGDIGWQRKIRFLNRVKSVLAIPAAFVFFS